MWPSYGHFSISLYRNGEKNEGTAGFDASSLVLHWMASFASGTNRTDRNLMVVTCRVNLAYNNSVYEEACVSEPVIWLL